MMCYTADVVVVLWQYSSVLSALLLSRITPRLLVLQLSRGRREVSLSDSKKEMDVSPPLKIDEGLKRLPLTPVRLIRGIICLLVYISTAFMMLVYFGPPVVGLMRLFSVHCCRKTTAFLFSMWLALWPFLFEKINGTKVVFSGDSVSSRERVLLISNHRTEVDWMYLWDLALRKGCLGSIKYVLKSTLMKLPLFGWGFHILEFISVERKWEVDEPVMRQMLSTFKDPRDPLWLALFPEGTDFTEQKCEKSKKYAAEVGLPVLTNVLLPKTRGFCICLEVLRGSFDAVYDITIAYKHQLPTFLDNVFGLGPSEVHMHVKRIPMEDIPLSDDEAATWLMDKFEFKDQLLSDFKSQGHFPHEGTENELSTLKCLANILSVIFLTVIFAYFTFFSSIWFKVYVILACAYLASVTYFDIRPTPSVAVGIVKKVFSWNKKARNE